MIRCIAIDLDDTLLSTDLRIAPEERDAISRAIGQGVRVLLASGRMVQSMQPYVDQLGLDVPLIAYNGAVIQESISGKVLYRRPVPREDAVGVIKLLREKGIHCNVYLQDRLYMDELTEWGKKYAATAGVEPNPVGDVISFMQESPHKLLAVGEVDPIERVRGELAVMFGGRLQFVKSKPNYLEILEPEVSKGKALAELTAGWGLDRSEEMAIGDAPNDLPMITWAGIGVAVGNADPVVKEKADWIVADHDHHGVAEAIRRAVLTF
jgi:Cof subfamily protein (haloacid dehalogenase superfamily)